MSIDQHSASDAPGNAAWHLPVIPSAFFGMVLGTAGLANAWRSAHAAWSLPSIFGEIIAAAAAVIWAVLLALYIGKVMLDREDFLTEAAHPIQCCFIGLIGVATMLVAGLAIPYSRPVAVVLFAVGGIFTIAFAAWRTGGLWQGGRDPATTTAVLYLPSVAGSFVTATIGSALGYPDWGAFALGAGLFSWFAIESVLLHRLLTGPELPPPLRPTLGVQLAPAPVGAVALISVAPDQSPIFAHLMIGYGLLQLLILIRLTGWIRKHPFGPAYWAFTFGMTSLAVAPLRLLILGDRGPIEVIAPIIFVLANVMVLSIAFGTVLLLFRGKLVEKRVPIARQATEDTKFADF